VGGGGGGGGGGGVGGGGTHSSEFCLFVLLSKAKNCQLYAHIFFVLNSFGTGKCMRISISTTATK